MPLAPRHQGNYVHKGLGIFLCAVPARLKNPWPVADEAAVLLLIDDIFL